MGISFLRWLVVVGAWLVWGPAAQAADLQRARQLFQEGSQLARQKQHKAALKKFRQSLHLVPQINNIRIRQIRTTLRYVIGLSSEKLGRLLQAERAYRLALETVARSNLRAALRRSLRRVRRKTALLILRVSPERVEVEVIDGAGQRHRRRGSASLRLHPGPKIRLLLRHRGYRTLRRQISLRARQRLILSIALARQPPPRRRVVLRRRVAPKGRGARRGAPSRRGVPLERRVAAKTKGSPRRGRPAPPWRRQAAPSRQEGKRPPVRRGGRVVPLGQRGGSPLPASRRQSRRTDPGQDQSRSLRRRSSSRPKGAQRKGVPPVPSRRQGAERLARRPAPPLRKTTTPPKERRGSAARWVALSQGEVPQEEARTRAAFPPTRVAALILGGLGLAAFGAAAITGKMMSDTETERDSFRQGLLGSPNATPQDTLYLQGLHESAEQYALITNVMFGVGGGLLLGSLILALLPPPPPKVQLPSRPAWPEVPPTE